MTTHQQWATNRDNHVLTLIDALAHDIGRLRRHTACHGTSLEHVADRLAHAVETLYWTHTPTAGQLAAAGCPVQDALDIVDEWQAQLEKTLGEHTRREHTRRNNDAAAQPAELAA